MAFRCCVYLLFLMFWLLALILVFLLLPPLPKPYFQFHFFIKTCFSLLIVWIYFSSQFLMVLKFLGSRLLTVSYFLLVWWFSYMDILNIIFSDFGISKFDSLVLVNRVFLHGVNSRKLKIQKLVFPLHMG